jgi:23S rRNA (uridine2552-2'-O)-methyltransferase
VNTHPGIIGTKIGMTQIFADNGDLIPCTVIQGGCVVIEGDAFDEALLSDGPVAEHAPFDVVVSDMAPNTTGDKTTDQIRSFDVFMRALAIADAALKPGGAFVGKLFMSGHFPAARDALRDRFGTVRTIRPEAVRDVSYEIFLVGLDRKAGAPEAPSDTGPDA